MPSELTLLPNEKQKRFYLARQRYIAYGGARGGGKSWAVRSKSALLALEYPGIRLLIIRRTLPELEENHIRPLRALLGELAEYREKDKCFHFANGSLLRFGYCDAENDVLRYQGQEYDCIFLDEATQLTEFQFQTFKGCLRGVNDFPKRIYVTCNPGGVGHAWVKRLFIDREYRAGESAEEYCFIPADVYDNKALMEQDTEYVQRLQSLPEELRRAWLEGSWDVFAGQFFPEWDRRRHVCAPFEIPSHWRRYVTLDYGMDMLAAYLIAVDERGKAWVVREIYEGRDLGEGHRGLIISQAASRLKELTEGENVYLTLAPPDLWSSSAAPLRNAPWRTSSPRRASPLCAAATTAPPGGWRCGSVSACGKTRRGMTRAALRSSRPAPISSAPCPSSVMTRAVPPTAPERPTS